MAITQRLDHYGTRHPRQTFAFGLTSGAAIAAGIVLAVALTIASDTRSPRAAVSAGAGITNEQAFIAEQDYRAANGIAVGISSAAALSDEQAFVAEQDYRAANGIAAGVSSAAAISDEQAFVAEQDYRAANGIGSTRSLAGVAPLTPELTAGMNDLVSGHRFVNSSPVPVDTMSTPELSAGMADLVPGYPFTWVTPELRAGIES